MDILEPCSPCDWASWQLCELRAGCLDATAAEALRSHLESCLRCREEQAWDDRLCNLLRDLPLPSPRGGIVEKVGHRLRRRREWRAGAAAAAVLLAGIFSWQLWSMKIRDSATLHSKSLPAADVNDLPGSPVLFAAPPVESLDLLARQQAGYVAVLRQLEPDQH